MDETDTVLSVALGDDIPAGSVITYFSCPNAHGLFDMHDPVPCQNCEEEVPGPDYHYYSIDGLLGSGRWTCTSKQQVAQLANEFLNLKIQPNDEGLQDATE